MARVKGGIIHKNKRKKVLKQAEGYFGSKHRLYHSAKEQIMHSLRYAYRDRRRKKRDFRKIWITRINAACRINNISYSKFIDGLTKAGVVVNRKMLSELAISNPQAFTELVNTANEALKGKKFDKETKAEAVKSEKVVAESTETKKAVKKETVAKTAKKTVKKEAEKKPATKKTVKKTK